MKHSGRSTAVCRSFCSSLNTLGLECCCSVTVCVSYGLVPPIAGLGDKQNKQFLYRSRKKNGFEPVLKPTTRWPSDVSKAFHPVIDLLASRWRFQNRRNSKNNNSSNSPKLMSPAAAEGLLREEERRGESQQFSCTSVFLSRLLLRSHGRRNRLKSKLQSALMFTM